MKLHEALGVSSQRVSQIIREEYGERSRGAWGSPCEEMLDALLLQAGAPKHYRQFHIGPFRVDFFFPSARLIVEVNGIYHETDRGRSRDTQLRSLLDEMGLVLLEIGTDEIEQEAPAVMERLVRTIQRHQRLVSQLHSHCKPHANAP